MKYLLSTALTAAMLFASPVKAETNAKAILAAVLTVYNYHCEELTGNQRRLAQNLVEQVGEAKVATQVTTLNGLRKDMGNIKWCGTVHSELMEGKADD